MKRSIRILALVLALTLLAGCAGERGTAGETSPNSVDSENSGTSTSETVETGAKTASDYFSDRDFEVGYDESESAIITLNGDSASCDSSAVKIDGGIVTILDEGTYILSGTLNDGMIVVSSEKSDKTQIVLNGVTIHSETSAAIYILQSDKVFITTAAGTVNTLSNGGEFTAIDENNIDGVIYSKEDLTLNGSGTLVVTSPAGHGIVSKDSLTITSGSYDINCASHALEGKDEVCIANADFTIVTGKDGIHAENNDDEASGYVYIQSGTFNISAEGDGITAASWMQIEDGSFNITAGGGSVNGEAHSSDMWGGFQGGGRHQGGGMMGGSMGGTTTTTTDEESTSMKGLKAGTSLTVNGGSFTIDSADDAVHSNGDAAVNGGTFAIATGDDAFHAEENLTVTAGTIDISESYEGLEGLYITVSGGAISLEASDDGLNAAGGTDSSGTTGGRDGMFGGGMMGGGMMGGSGSGSIVISGGNLYINASGDGIDANGTFEMTGGYCVVCGPTQGDTATLDYDVSAVITGGTFIGTGASSMAQTFSDSGQGVIALTVGNQSAGTQITLTDSEGNVVLTHAPELSFGVVILSSTDIIKGESYTITVGSAQGTFSAS